MIHQFGPHRVRCGDFRNIAELMGDERADVIVVDPPWGQGNIHYWQTVNARHNPGAVKQTIGYGTFLDSLFEAFTKYGRGTAIVEYGQKWRGDIVEYAHKFGFQHQVFGTIYRSGSKMLPSDVHVMTAAPWTPPAGYAEKLATTAGLDCAIAIVAPFGKPGGLILDPCCGLGLYAAAAIKAGMRFYGNELNAKRLQTTIGRLKKAVK